MPLSFQRVKSTIFLPIGGKPSFYSSHVEPAIGLCVCNNSLCHNLFSPIQSLQSLLTATFQHTMKPKITSPVTSPLVLISVAAYFGGHFRICSKSCRKNFRMQNEHAGSQYQHFIVLCCTIDWKIKCRLVLLVHLWNRVLLCAFTVRLHSAEFCCVSFKRQCKLWS